MRALLTAPGEEDPLSQIARAVQAGEVVGVKLYPPMGFQATGNADFPAKSFPRLLREKYGEKSGMVLDRELQRLFVFCRDNDVPIMAHCGDSNYPTDGYGQRAAPSPWLSLLDTGFGRLRLNLGHFGGIWSFGNESAKDAPAADLWPQLIVRALCDPDRLYPNLYTDVAYASNLLVSGDKCLSGDFMSHLSRLRGTE